MKKEDFYNSKWDCSEWTEDQKTQWQEKCLELGFTWRGTLGKSKCEEYITHAKSCYLYGGGYITFNSSVDGYSPHSNTEKQFADMFPEEKLDVVAEIVKMVQKSSEVSEQEEDERGFEELMYTAPITKCYILVENLSNYQKMFLDSKLHYFDPDRICNVDYLYLDYDPVMKDWVLCDWVDMKSELKISFNDIFKYKED